jgi:hypothetical protein
LPGDLSEEPAVDLPLPWPEEPAAAVLAEGFPEAESPIFPASFPAALEAAEDPFEVFAEPAFPDFCAELPDGLLPLLPAVFPAVLLLPDEPAFPLELLADWPGVPEAPAAALPEAAAPEEELPEPPPEQAPPLQDEHSAPLAELLEDLAAELPSLGF